MIRERNIVRLVSVLLVRLSLQRPIYALTLDPANKLSDLSASSAAQAEATFAPHSALPFVSVPSSAMIDKAAPSKGPPIAAIAVPLSLCGALLLAAIFVAIRRKRASTTQASAQANTGNAATAPVQFPLTAMHSSVSLPVLSKDGYLMADDHPGNQPPAYIRPFAPTYSRNSSGYDLRSPYDAEYRYSSGNFRKDREYRDMRGQWEDSYDQETRRLSRHPTWKSWFPRPNRDRSPVRKELEREREFDREVAWRRHAKERDKERQMEYEWYEEQEREERRRSRNRSLGRSHWKPVMRSGASRSTHRSGFVASRRSQASHSPTGTTRGSEASYEFMEPEPLPKIQDPINIKHYATLPNRPRSRVESEISQHRLVDERPMLI
jgi:hypothetical protein